MEHQAKDEAGDMGHCIEMTGDLDRQTAEVIHRLAKRYGLTVKGLLVHRGKDESS